MGIFISLIKKEAVHIVRDRRTMVITLVMPVMLLLLFGFAISTEVNDVRVVAVVDRHTPQTREILERLHADSYFTFLGIVSDSDVDGMLRRGETDAALYLRTDAGVTVPHIVVDASNPVVGQASSTYLTNIVTGDSASAVLTETLYNPQLKSAYNFVPGIMGMIFILVCAIMTSVSIVSEKENGTMDLLLVSPVRPGMVIFGKLVPYFALSCVILAVMLVMAYTVLGLPASSTIASVTGVTLLYVVLSLSIGLLVSTMVDNQVSALVVSAVLFMLPVIMLSGMIFPVDNMPRVLQWLSAAIPARWYVAAMRRMMIQQLGFMHVWREVAVLGGMTVVILGVAVMKFNSTKR